MDRMKIEYSGLDKLIEGTETIYTHTMSLGRGALGAAAGVVADEVRKAIEALPAEKEKENGRSRWATPDDPLTGVTNTERQDLLNALGISSFKQSGSEITTSIGFDGYGSIPTKTFPQGVPNALLMRAIESGTTFRKKTPVIRRARVAGQKKANEAAQKKLNDLVKKMIGD